MAQVISPTQFSAEEKKNKIPRDYEYKEHIAAVLPANIRSLLDNLFPEQLESIEEIRLRCQKPLLLRLAAGEFFLTPLGRLTKDSSEAYHISPEELQRTLQMISHASLYALEEELRNGYLTVRGGHRIGFAGEAVVEKGRVKVLKNISSLNIRIAKEMIGCANPIMKYLYNISNGNAYHTLIISPPSCGKTTLLRDIIRQFSQGIDFNLGKRVSLNVGLVDERSEIAGCYHGIPQKDIGPRTDVLDACPKAEGMLMLLRSMSPSIIATDEVGRAEDIQALEELLNAGVTILTTVHGSSIAELELRPTLKNLLGRGIFQRYIILSRKLGSGTIEQVIDAAKGLNLLSCPIPGKKGG